MLFLLGDIEKVVTGNGMKISEKDSQFAKSRFSILEYLNKVGNRIKLFFIPNVVKRDLTKTSEKTNIPKSNIYFDNILSYMENSKIYIYFYEGRIHYIDKRHDESLVIPHSVFLGLINDYMKTRNFHSFKGVPKEFKKFKISALKSSDNKFS